MGQNQEFRNRYTQIWPVDLGQKCKGNSMENDSLFNECVWDNWTYTCKK